MYTATVAVTTPIVMVHIFQGFFRAQRGIIPYATPKDMFN